jgi:hypothetical protein
MAASATFDGAYSYRFSLRLFPVSIIQYGTCHNPSSNILGGLGAESPQGGNIGRRNGGAETGAQKRGRRNGGAV